MPRVHTSALDTSALRRAVSRFLRDEDGASLVEYVLLIALIAVVCVTAS